MNKEKLRQSGLSDNFRGIVQKEKNQYARPWRQSFEEDLHLLPLKAMKIQCLDADMKEISGAHGSGLVLVEDGKSYLYTCWHLVTGFGFGPVKVPLNHVTRMFLRVTARNNDGSSVFGGEMDFIVCLYRDREHRYPDWEQSPIALPHPTINSVNIAVPHCPDVARIKVPDDVKLSFMQVFYAEEFNQGIPPLKVIDQVFVVGYPHGYSALSESPSAIVLPLWVSSTVSEKGNLFVILDRPCASGMSGSPVLMNIGGVAQVVGVYSGLIYTDYLQERTQGHTTLGRFEDLRFHREGRLKFINAGLDEFGTEVS